MIDRYLSYITHLISRIPPTVALALALIFCVGTVLLLAFKGVKIGLRCSAALALVEYLFLLILLAVWLRKVQDFRECGLIPFASYRPVLDGTRPLSAQVIANILAFVPIGLLLGCAFGPMKWWKVLAVGGGFSLLIEVLQFFLKRGFAEFDDVFHNVLGCMVGYGVYMGLRWLIRFFGRF